MGSLLDYAFLFGDEAFFALDWLKDLAECPKV